MRLGICIIACTLIAAVAGADSLFSRRVESEGTLVSTKRKAFKEGDIVTIVVKETIEARTRANSDTEKQAGTESQAPAAANEFFVSNNGLNIFKPEELPNFEVQYDNQTEAEGETRHRNTLTLTIACTVTRVNDNGTIELEGQKRIRVNREDTTLEVKGTCRSGDVTAANTLDSTLMANAEIDLTGKGPIWNAQRRGILSRILDWFSPY